MTWKIKDVDSDGDCVIIDDLGHPVCMTLEKLAPMICAAPDLLAALKALRKSNNIPSGTDGRHVAIATALMLADAAIAKAEGDHG